MGIGRIIREAFDAIAPSAAPATPPPAAPAANVELTPPVKPVEEQLAEAAADAPANVAGVQEAVSPVVKSQADQAAALEERAQANADEAAKIAKEKENLQLAQSGTPLEGVPGHATLQPQNAVKEASNMDPKKVAETAVPGTDPKPEVAAAAPEADEKGKTIGAAAEAAPTGVEIPATTAPTAPEAEAATTEQPKNAFSMRFVQGTSFDNSYFVAEDGKQFYAVKASRIIPVPVQNKIIHALASTQAAPTDVVSPTEIVEQLEAQGVDTLETFKSAMLTLEASCKATGTEKTAGLMAWNDAEVTQPKVKAGDEPIVGWATEEFAAGQKMHPAPHGMPSKVKQYYGRLPTAAGGKPEVALNPQSALMLEKIELLRKALDEQKAKTDLFENKAKDAEKKVGDLEKGNEDKEHSGLMEGIVKDLVGKKLIDMKDEQQAISLLSKVERKSLPHVASLLKLLGKGGKDMGMGMGEGPAAGAPKALPLPGMEEKKSPFGGDERAPKASMQLPPAFVEERQPDIASAPSFMAKFWDAK